METTTNQNCMACGTTNPPGARFCAACGRALAGEPETVLLPASIRIAADAVSVRDLLALVEAGVAWWRVRLTSDSPTTRQDAAQAVGELSQIMQSLAAQLAQGRETVRFTARLPVRRAFPVGCPLCGRGNRERARFCQHCGAALGVAPAKRRTMSNPAWTYRIGMLSDVGRARSQNEDTCLVEPVTVGGTQGFLCLVADGMGGALAGEQASRIAAETVVQQVRRAIEGVVPASDEDWQALLRQAARTANRRVYTQAQSSSDQRGMGTTLTTALLIDNRVQIAQVGDSRAYLFNQNGLTDEGSSHAQLTSDHSLVARLVDIGQITPQEARTHPQRNLLYRSIGTDPTVDVDTYSQQLQDGDVLLLCSDGLTNHVEDEELAAIVLEAESPETACIRLIALANERGGRDNISAIVVQCRLLPNEE